MKSLFVTFPALAIPKGRPRFGRGVTFTPQKTKSFEGELRWHWIAEKRPMLPVAATSVEITCYLPIPKSKIRQLQREMGSTKPIVKPDLDNVAKAILDAMNGFAWKDDNQITDLTIRKRYTLDAPSIEMLLRWEDV